LKIAIELVEKQARQNEESVYRLGAGATALRVQDPDPHAADEGNILGVRIEIFEDGKIPTPSAQRG
jgi:central kinetochore subunit Mal2/MCM21